MKLKYTATRHITTADLLIPADPPIEFEVKSRPSREWAVLFREFEHGNGKDVNQAMKLISLSFITVAQDDEIYPLGSIAAVGDLRDAIEVDNPGHGDDFICNVAWGFGNHFYTWAENTLGNLRERSQPLNGSGRQRSKAKVS